MPKKRKTRKEKILHDQQKQVVPESASPVVSSPKNETQQKQELATPNITFSLSDTQNKPTEAIQKTKPSLQSITVSQNDYSYLSNDLMRTALLTGAIVFAELVIKLFIVH